MGTAPDAGRRRIRRVLLAIVLLPAFYYLLCVAGLVYLRYLPPLATGVQFQRTIERAVGGERPLRDYRWRATDQISVHVPRAVVAAEDARFFQHRGFDWVELRRAREQARAAGEPMRGSSTLTHQLIKNLYFTTHRNPARKALRVGPYAAGGVDPGQGPDPGTVRERGRVRPRNLRRAGRVPTPLRHRRRRPVAPPGREPRGRAARPAPAQAAGHGGVHRDHRAAHEPARLVMGLVSAR